MNENTVFLLKETLGWIACILGLFVNIPQIILTYKTKNLEGLSFINVALSTIVSILWVIYGTLGHDVLVQVIISSSMRCMSSIILLCMYVRYHNSNNLRLPRNPSSSRQIPLLVNVPT